MRYHHHPLKVVWLRIRIVPLLELPVVVIFNLLFSTGTPGMYSTPTLVASGALQLQKKDFIWIRELSIPGFIWRKGPINEAASPRF